MALTRAQMLEAIEYTLTYSKGLIEDNHSCPAIAEAFENGGVTSAELEKFIEEAKAVLLAHYTP